MKGRLWNVGRGSIASKECFGRILFLCTLSHVISWLKCMCLRTYLWPAIPEAHWGLPMSAAISIVHLRTYVNAPFWPPEKVVSRWSSYFSPWLANSKYIPGYPSGSECTTDRGWGGQGALWGGLENQFLRTERHHLENTAPARNGLPCV